MTTPNLGLSKPAGTDDVDITVLNGNFDLLDSAVLTEASADAAYAEIAHTHAPEDPTVLTPNAEYAYFAIDVDGLGAIRFTASSVNLAIQAPDNGVDGQMLMIEVYATGATRTVFFHEDIVRLPGNNQSNLVASGKVGFFGLRYSEATGTGTWYLLATGVGI